MTWPTAPSTTALPASGYDSPLDPPSEARAQLLAMRAQVDDLSAKLAAVIGHGAPEDVVPGRIVRVQGFYPGTYPITLDPLTKMFTISLQAPGGAGGGAPTTAAGRRAIGQGGGGGAFIKFMFTVLPAGALVLTVAPKVVRPAAGAPGPNGGQTRFEWTGGSLIAQGGVGGLAGSDVAASSDALVPSAGGGDPSHSGTTGLGVFIVLQRGGSGVMAMASASGPIAGCGGGASFMSPGADRSYLNAANAATAGLSADGLGFGGGGGGAISYGATAVTGGDSGMGYAVLEEYS